MDPNDDKKITTFYFLERLGAGFRQAYGRPERPEELPAEIQNLLRKLRKAGKTDR